MKRSAPALLAILTLATTAAAPGPREGPVGFGQSAYVGGPLVTPLKLIEDSRCPVELDCVWPGRLVIRARVATGAGAREIDLTLAKPAPVADGMLTLMSVTPERSRNAKTRVDYRFTFKFSGGL